MTRVKAWSEKTGFIDELIDLSEAEISSRFDEVIDFGTGGMRAVMAAGTNRMNVYTVRLASLGLVREIKSQDVTNPRVVISYDTRHNSRLYAEETARTLQHYGIEALVFEESRPTPMLSYAVRYYEATAGVMITASHNPKEYNGYKLYGSDGGQLTPEAVSSIRQVMQKEVDTILNLEFKQSEPVHILREVETAYLKELIVLKSDLVERDLSIVYTPLHGSGREPIKKAFQAFGYKSLYLEPAQSEQKGSFPTVVVPNPEEKEAFKYAIKLGEEKSADILIATDPDADRLGVAVLHNGEYELLTGNQLGALLLYYKLNHLKSQGKLPENGVVIKTIVTSELGRKIAEHFNVDMEDTLTGFKYISEKIEQYTRTGEKTYLFGYEESYGYLLEPFARDKDAIQAAVATSELAQACKKEDKTLVDGLNELYELFGYYKESLISLELDPIKGSEQVEVLMNRFKVPNDTLISELEIEAIEDYQARKKYTLITDEVEPLNLPQENVIKYQLKDEAWICFRPSGTEPKMKVYFGVNCGNSQQSKKLINNYHSIMKNILYKGVI